MRHFADLLETVTPAAATTAARDLTTAAKVKEALKITSSTDDALIATLITRVSAAIVAYCRLAQDAAGSVPTFGRETLRATWYVQPFALFGGTASALRGFDIFLPWRAPVFSVDSVVEGGNTLAATTDYVLLGSKGGRLRRLSSDVPFWWSSNKLVVTWKAGFASTLATNVEGDLEAAAIEQIKGVLFGASRDPSVRSESVPDVASITYSVPGGDVMGASSILPAVRDMLAPWRNPAP